MSEFFYDSYAFIEYFNGNPHFKPYFEKHTGITTLFNVAEVYYSLLHDKGKAAADDILPTLLSLIVEVDGEIIQKAMLFRFFHRKQKLSYADCIGYGISRERGIPFLTGDVRFKDIKDVEFVK